MTGDISRLEQEIAELKKALAQVAGIPAAEEALRAQLDEKERQLAGRRSPTAAGPSVGSVAGETVYIATQQCFFTPDGTDPDALLREYLRALTYVCNRLSLADAASSDPQHGAVELASVFTGLEVASTVELTDEEKRRLFFKPRQRTALEALAGAPRLALLGHPGSGKSTLFAYVALCLAHARLGAPGWRERLHPLADHRTPIPIPVILRAFASWVAVQQPRPSRGSADLLWRWLTEDQRYPAALVARLRRAIDAGNAILLLDGLDEVPADRSGQPLALVVETIQALAAVAGACPVVVSCRVIDYQQPERRLPRWTEETLIPFSPELRHAFIDRWFDALVRLGRPMNGDPDDLRKRLHDEVQHRAELRRLAGNPLLLTMMTWLHAYYGRLPDERVKLYERCVEFLVLHWRARPGEPTLADRLELPQWRESDLGLLLDRIGFAAHVQGVGGDDESGADVPHATLIETARTFFVRYDRDRAYGRAEAFVTYVRDRGNGVLLPYGPDLYRFPHRTFQEYLAARRLVDNDDWSEEEGEFVARALRYADRGPHWREALLLAVSQQVIVNRATDLVAALADALLTRHPRGSAAWARDATLAGEALAEVGRARLGERREALRQRTVAALIETLERLDGNNAAVAPLDVRLRAGAALGALGDPRFPVTPDEWRASLANRNETFGAPQGYWCYVPGGRYCIGGWKRGETSADLDLRPFWIARFPITVAQYRAFIEDGGYARDDWTPRGRAWRDVSKRTQPWGWDEPQYASPHQPVVGVTWYEATAFCAWLHARCAAALPDGYAIRLPTEAEWEVAAAYDGNRQRRAYPWGNDEPTPERAIYKESSLSAPAPVGVCPAGAAACGALDMAGNVWEVTTSLYGKYPAGSSQWKKDFTTDKGDVTWRGGSYRRDSTGVRCGARCGYLPSVYRINVGFRIVVAPHSH